MILTVEDAKTIPSINIDVEDYSLDDTLTSICEEVTTRIETICRQPIEQVTKSAYRFIGSGTYEHTFPFSRISTIANVYYRATPVTAWTAVDSGDVVVLSESATVYNDNTWIAGMEYKADIVVGWSTVPLDIVSVAREMVQIQFMEMGSRGSDARPIGLAAKGESIGGGNVSTSFMEMLPKWEYRLSRYRVPTV